MHQQPIRVLLIDNNVPFVSAFSDLLSEAAVACSTLLSTAATEEEALDRIVETPPDVVLLSLQPSHGSWVDITKRLLRAHSLIPILILADSSHEKAARRAVCNGATDYFLKNELNARDLVHLMRFVWGTKQDNNRLKKVSRQWRATFDSIPDWIIIVDEFCEVVRANRAVAGSFGLHPRDMVGKNCRGLIGGTDWLCEECPQRAVIKGGTSRITEIYNRRLLMHQLITSAPLLDERGRIIGVSPVVKDMSEKKQAEFENKTLIAELQEALSRVKTLSGLLPICASCKRIRDDRGNWNPIEAYIRDRSNAQFSHGICPECAKKLYPDYFKDR